MKKTWFVSGALLVALGAGCNKGGTGGGTGGGPGGGTGGAGPTYGTGPCAACVATACASQIDACKADPECPTFLACLDACPITSGGDAQATCVAACPTGSGTESK